MCTVIKHKQNKPCTPASLYIFNSGLACDTCDALCECESNKWIAFDYHANKQCKHVTRSYLSEEECKQAIKVHQKDRKVVNRLVYPLQISNL